MMKATLIGIALTLCLLTAPAVSRAQDAGSSAAVSPQVAAPADGGVDWPGVGYGALTVLSDAVYIPAKLVYATVGGITGGAAWAVTGGNQQAANTIWRSSLGGDYVLTPQHIRGDQPIYFSGPTQTPPAQGAMTQAQAAAEPMEARPRVMESRPGVAMPADRGTGPVAPRAPRLETE